MMQIAVPTIKTVKTLRLAMIKLMRYAELPMMKLGPHHGALPSSAPGCPLWEFYVAHEEISMDFFPKRLLDGLA